MKKSSSVLTFLALTMMFTGCAKQGQSSSSDISSEPDSSIPYVAVESIEFIAEEVNLHLDEEIYLEYKVLPDNATNQAVTFETLDDEVAIPSSDGKVSPNRRGTTQIIVKSLENPEISAECTVNVVFANAREINVDQEQLTVKMGKTAQITAEVEPREASSKLTWTSLNEDVAIVQDGFITPVSVGSTTIKVASVTNPSVETICQLTVTSDVDDNSAFKIANDNVTWDVVDPKQYVQNKGEQKVLVIPIYFKDEADTYTPEQMKQMRDYIEMSFFGDNDDCGWRSFSGYYKQASFDKLHYSGHVSEGWYKAPYTTEQVNDNDNNIISAKIVPNALYWFKKTYSDFDLTDYDTNHDNYIDSLYIIYAADYGDWGSGLWGFRSSANDTKNITGKKASAYSWFSIEFLRDTGAYGGVPEDGSNTRIIIHEHGHMLGLPDYYDYSYAGIDCVGSYDMQSSNTFDWNAFSKFSAGWVKPYYVDQTKLEEKGSETITIGDSGTTGECILLRNSEWNGTPFDEYLMIELFNPDAGNNYYDSHYSNYQGPKNCGFGVKIYHVDARMVELWDGGDNTVIIHQVDDFSSSNDYAFFPNDNNEVNSSDHNYYLKYYAQYYSQYGYTLQNWQEYNSFQFLHLLQKGNECTFTKKGNYRLEWNNSDLWQTGDTFSITNHYGYTNYGPNFFAKSDKLNDGSAIPYGIRFNSVTKNSATLTISYIG